MQLVHEFHCTSIEFPPHHTMRTSIHVPTTHLTVGAPSEYTLSNQWLLPSKSYSQTYHRRVAAKKGYSKLHSVIAGLSVQAQ